MPHLTISPEEIVRRGQDYYDRFLRDKREPEHRGEFLMLNIETGEYEMDKNERLAFERATTRWPSSVFYILRIGYRAAHRLGARGTWRKP